MIEKIPTPKGKRKYRFCHDNKLLVNLIQNTPLYREYLERVGVRKFLLKSWSPWISTTIAIDFNTQNFSHTTFPFYRNAVETRSGKSFGREKFIHSADDNEKCLTKRKQLMLSIEGGNPRKNLWTRTMTLLVWRLKNDRQNYRHKLKFEGLKFKLI